MYFTDRTSLFLKIQKQFDFWQFTIAMSAALVLGVVTCKKPEKDLGFLNRDQTDEVREFRYAPPPVLMFRLPCKVERLDANCHPDLSLLWCKQGLGHL